MSDVNFAPYWVGGSGPGPGLANAQASQAQVNNFLANQQAAMAQANSFSPWANSGGGFGVMPAHYAAQGAAFGRATGGFAGLPGRVGTVTNPGVSNPGYLAGRTGISGIPMPAPRPASAPAPVPRAGGSAADWSRMFNPAPLGPAQSFAPSLPSFPGFSGRGGSVFDRGAAAIPFLQGRSATPFGMPGAYPGAGIGRSQVNFADLMGQRSGGFGAGGGIVGRPAYNSLYFNPAAMRAPATSFKMPQRAPIDMSAFGRGASGIPGLQSSRYFGAGALPGLGAGFSAGAGRATIPYGGFGRLPQSAGFGAVPGAAGTMPSDQLARIRIQTTAARPPSGGYDPLDPNSIPGRLGGGGAQRWGLLRSGYATGARERNA